MRLFGRKLTVNLRKMSYEDIDAVREVGRRAWSDLYSREFRQDFDVPMRSRENILFYMDKEPDGCIVADGGGSIVGDVFCHIWGRVGWFGPVEVLPSQQNAGIGKQLIVKALEYLASRKCTVIGLETMPETVKNVHIYSELGCVPDRATYLLEKHLTRRDGIRVGGHGYTFATYRDLGEEISLESVSRLSSASFPEVDYSREVKYSMKHETGETIFMLHGDKVVGFALVYTYSTSDGSNNASIRFMAVEREHSKRENALAMLAECERVAIEAGRDRMHVRFYTGSFAVYRPLRDAGYQLRGTNLRMLYAGSIPSDTVSYRIDSWAG